MNCLIKLTEIDIIKAYFALSYSKNFIKIFIGLFSFFLIFACGKAIFGSTSAVSDILIFSAALLGFNASLLFIAKKVYKTNKMHKETIEYIFNEQRIVVRGASYTYDFDWRKIYKVSQTRNWLFLWQNSQLACIIPKSQINQEQVAYIKSVANQHNIKNNL